MSITDKQFDEVKKIQLEILLEFDRVCRENDIKYSLYFGTLLGAVRHKGFIPWDDDIDVVMERGEYNKFMEIQKKNIDSNFFVQNYETDPNFFRSFSRIRKNDTLYLQRFFQHVDIHHGIFIDIFPFDSVYEDVAKEKKRIKLLQRLRRINVIKYFGVDEKANILKKISQKTIDFIIPNPWFNQMITKVNIKRNDQNLEWCSHLTDRVDNTMFKKWLIKKDELLDLVELEFEGHKFYAIKSYKNVLENIYGDYMELPPVEQRVPHHQIIKIKY